MNGIKRIKAQRGLDYEITAHGAIGDVCVALEKF